MKEQGKTPSCEIQLNYLVIDNKVYNTKKYDTSFSTTTPYIILTKDIYDDVIYKYLGRHIKSFKCKKYGYGTREYDCDCLVLPELSSIGFIIDNNYFNLKAEELFFRYENRCVLNIILNEDIYNIKENQIILGIHFLWNYNSLFDKVDRGITFFSNEAFPDINIINSLIDHNNVSLLYIMIDIITFVGIINIISNYNKFIY